jgi:iron complex outermembrane receptor protein
MFMAMNICKQTRYIPIWIMLMIFSSGNSLAQNINNNDTLIHDTKELPEFFVTATRTNRLPDEVPARISSITAKVIDIQPALTTDALLDLIPGANIDRPQGIFSKNASITLRGLNGSPRLLILVDGVPVSKTDGGGVNWNRMIPENIQRIEVIKGPVSTVYGGNAMAGVINVITRQPTGKLEGEVKISAGSCNTFGGLINLGGTIKSGRSHFYYGLTGFYREGAGYIIVPESARDSLDVKTYLTEYNLSAKVGYRYGIQSFTEIELSHYYDKRGDGTRIYEPDGGYNQYPTNYFRVTSNNLFGKFNWIVRAFRQDENYLRQSETMSEKKGRKYTLYHTDADRVDFGIWTDLTWHLNPSIDLTAGLDLKQGSVDGTDTYITSTDILENKGKMNFLALFGEMEWQSRLKTWSVLAGLRFDAVRFFDGSFTILEPSTLTSFMTAYPTVFNDSKWQSWSPKIGVKYRPSTNADLYFSYAHGFRPGMLDDMCRNGNISKGFKLANPDLQPEKADNFEVGGNFRVFDLLTIEPSFYYTLGTDFHYFVGNGDSVATGGDNLKPILQRQNVSKVKVSGAEITVSMKITDRLSATANYAWNYSRIESFDTTGHPGKDITGNYIVEVPKNQCFAGIYYRDRSFQSSLIFNIKGPQWSDDENSFQTPGYHTFDFKIGKSFFDHLIANLVIQDIFDTRYYDSKGNVSPGRFFMLSLACRFNLKQ